MTCVAVFGAGLSGLVFADTLGDAAQIKLFDKSRGYGGRMATRRYAAFQFDHGAQFFTARSKSFESFLEPCLAAGVVARWDARSSSSRVTG
jgi:renalase